ncbi:hypothetical protein KKE06_00420 [Candidatus Micrarchaeota archaeon]|nr:hypothetical protein [Candidatus Micrarchaeota archaeon]MBU1929995.1 hypothetical protein [Candidatus Micrarchaeota archaeon]
MKDIFLIGFLLSSLFLAGCTTAPDDPIIGAPEPHQAAKSILRDAFIRMGIPQTSPKIMLSPNITIQKNSLISIESGIDPNNVCLSLGDFENDSSFSSTATSVSYSDSSKKDVHFWALCDGGDTLADRVIASGGSASWAQNCGNEPLKTFCVVALKSS